MRPQALRKKEGFTLIELIIALVIAAVVATGVASFLGPSLTESGRPLANLRRSGQLRSIMENITNHYNTGASLSQLQTNLGIANFYQGNTGLSYQATRYFVKFTAGLEDTNNPGMTMLKVTISATGTPGETLTTLFTVP